VQTAATAFDLIYTKLPARFAPLYEELIFSHRWADVELQDFTLLANPPNEGLTGCRNAWRETNRCGKR